MASPMPTDPPALALARRLSEDFKIGYFEQRPGDALRFQFHHSPDSEIASAITHWLDSKGLRIVSK